MKPLIYLMLRIRCLRIVPNVVNEQRLLKVSIHPNKVCFTAVPGPGAAEGQRWTLCVSHNCFLRASAHKLTEELVSRDPAVLWLGWRSSLSQRVPTCVSCFKEQAAKVEAVEQESCSLSSVNACLCAARVTVFPYSH